MSIITGCKDNKNLFFSIKKRWKTFKKVNNKCVDIPFDDYPCAFSTVYE